MWENIYECILLLHVLYLHVAIYLEAQRRKLHRVQEKKDFVVVDVSLVQRTIPLMAL